MATYKEALKQILENELKPRKKRKVKHPHSVSFKTPPLEKRKKPLKRRHPTPYKSTVPRNEDFDIQEENKITTKSCDNDSSSIKRKTWLINKALDFDVQSDSSDNSRREARNVIVSDWIKETDWTVSPSASEFPTNNINNTGYLHNTYQEQANTSSLTNISVEYNDPQSPHLSHLFDCISSDSSSSDTESYIKQFPKNTNYSFASEKEPIEGVHTDNTSNLADESICSADESLNVNQNLYNNIIWEISGGCIIILNRNSPLYFHGTFILSVLYGAVEILGFTLKPSYNEIELYSLHGTSYLFLENKCTGEDHECDESNIEIALSNLKIESRVMKKIIKNWSPTAAIVFCKTFASQNLQFLEKHTAQKLLPKPTAHNLLCTFRIDFADWNVLRISNYWANLANQIDASSRIMLCGGKGVGKSTLLKFLINKLLMTYPKILIIDLDPGQPEFTVCGCISASIISKPVFGPNYTHLQTPDKCVFVRDINISYDPSEYLNCVVELINACTDLPINVPTIINYMGYSRGLGLNLIASVIPLVSPTLVVQIQSAKKQRNFPQKLSSDVMKTHSKLLNLNSTDKVSQYYDLIELDSMTDHYEGWQMEPRIFRELGILSYFSRMLDFSNSCLTSSKVPMYRVNLSNICTMSGESNALASINANMVALCSVLETVNTFKCYGWGIVRGVDTENNELYLLTPLPINELENVTHLLLGSGNLPPAVYMAQDDKLGIVPYVSLGLMTNFNSIPKRSYLHKSTYTNKNMSG